MNKNGFKHMNIADFLLKDECILTQITMSEMYA